jgi:hypothetical protein
MGEVIGHQLSPIQRALMLAWDTLISGRGSSRSRSAYGKDGLARVEFELIIVVVHLSMYRAYIANPVDPFLSFTFLCEMRSSCQSYNPIPDDSIQLSLIPTPPTSVPSSGARRVRVRPMDVLVPRIISPDLCLAQDIRTINAGPSCLLNISLSTSSHDERQLT